MMVCGLLSLLRQSLSFSTEAAYSVYWKELLAWVWVCERFKDILADHSFILRSDSEALTINTSSQKSQKNQ